MNFLEKTLEDITIGELIDLFREEIEESIDIPAHAEVYKIPNPLYLSWKKQSDEYCGVEKPEDVSDTNFKSLITAKFKSSCPNIRDKYIEIMDWITANPKPEVELIQSRSIPKYHQASETCVEIKKILDTIEQKLLI